MATSNNNIITPDTLKPVEPMQTVPPVQDTTNYGGIVSGVYDSILSEYNTLNANVKAGEKVQADTGSDILSVINELTGKTQATQTAQETAGVNKAREEQNKYAEQLANLNAQASVLNREAQAIPLQVQEQFKNTGATDRGVAPIETGKLRENAIRALSIAQQSDIASAALTGSALRLKAAEDKAQQIIDLKYKPLEETLVLKEKQYALNKDILDKYDKKRSEALALQIEKEKNALAEEKQTEKDIQNLALKIGGFGADSATIQRVMKAKDFNEALTFAGKYLQNPKDSLDMQLTKAQIAKTWADAKNVDKTTGTLTEAQLKQIDTSPQGKKLVSLSGLYQKSQTYKNLLDTYGFQAVGSEKAKLDQAYADLKIAYKEAANLGALTGPDVTLLEEAIKPASGATNYLNYKLSGGKKGVSGAIDGALSKARAEALQNFKQLTARKPEYRGSEYVTSLIVPFATDYSKADIDNMNAGEIIQTEDGILLESLGNGQFTPL